MPKKWLVDPDLLPGHTGAEDTDPMVEVDVKAQDQDPVIIGFVLGAVPLMVATVSGLADIFTGVPAWVVPTFAIMGTLTTGLASLWARLKVTPLANPRDNDGDPLVPVVLQGRKVG